MKKILFYVGCTFFILFVGLILYGGMLKHEKQLSDGIHKDVLVVDKDERTTTTGGVSSKKYSLKVYTNENLHDIDVDSSVYKKHEIGSKLKVIEYDNRILLDYNNRMLLD